MYRFQIVKSMVTMITFLALLAVCHALPAFLELQAATPMTTQPEMSTFGSAFLVSMLSTIVVEARDKTFVLTGLYAATKMRRAVAAGALTAMLFLTLVDALIGYIFVPMIEGGWVNWAAVIAYAMFFWLYVKDAWYFTPQDIPDTLRQPLLDKPADGTQQTADTPPQQEPLQGTPVPAAPVLSIEERRRRWLDLYLKAAALIFLGEWSDATMVSTSNLAQKNDFLGVVVGCMVAYCITTTIAVFAGRWIGSKMQYRRLLVLTAVIFLLFAVLTVLY